MLATVEEDIRLGDRSGVATAGGDWGMATGEENRDAVSANRRFRDGGVVGDGEFVPASVWAEGI
jgi:hypothetical protein